MTAIRGREAMGNKAAAGTRERSAEWTKGI